MCRGAENWTGAHPSIYPDGRAEGGDGSTVDRLEKQVFTITTVSFYRIELEENRISSVLFFSGRLTGIPEVISCLPAKVFTSCRS